MRQQQLSLHYKLQPLFFQELNFDFNDVLYEPGGRRFNQYDFLLIKSQ